MSVKHYVGVAFDNLLKFLDPPSRSQWSSIVHEIGNGDTLLDLGCGEGNHLDAFLVETKNLHITGIDSHKESLEIAQMKNKYNEIICGDIFNELGKLRDNSYDIVIACDLIEHLTRDGGKRLMIEMRRVARKVSIIATPNGFVYQPPKPSNPANEHISGWVKSDFEELDYQIKSGHYGLKWLRGTYGLPRVKPMHLGNLLASLTTRPLSRFPSLNYQIVAIAKKSRLK